MISAEREQKSRTLGDLLPATTLGLVLLTSLVILCHLAVVLWLSWTSGRPGDPDLTYTTHNFVEVFSDARTYTVLLNTFAFAFVALTIALAFGVPIAWIAERTDFRAKTLLFTLMAIGLLIPGFAAAMGWLFLLHPRIGLLNRLLIDVFQLSGPPLQHQQHHRHGLGAGAQPGAARVHHDGRRLPLHGPDAGRGRRSARRRRTDGAARASPCALAWPGILAAAIYIFMTAFAAFDVPAIIGWGNRIFTFTTYLYLLLNPQDVLPSYGLAAALSTVALAIAALMSWWYGAMQQRSRRFAVVTGRAYRPKIVRLGRRKTAAWLFIGSYLVLSKLMPIMLLVWSSLLPFFQLPSSRALATVSLAHYFTLPWELVLTAMWNTSILAVLTPTVTLAISLAFSWIVLRSRIPGRGFFDFIAFLPHAVPSIVFGVGALLLTLFVLQRALPIYGTIWILLIVFTIARISYGTRMTNSGLIQIHPELEESAQMSGASLLGGVPPHLGAALGADAALCLAVDRAADVPRADACRHPVDGEQHHLSGRGLEPVARRRARAGVGARHRDAADDGAFDRAVLAVCPPSGHHRDLGINFSAPRARWR